MDNGGKITDRLIAEADIQAGARALDFGCGNGAITFRLADAVGPSGQVLGIDLNEAALNAAREKAEADGITHVTFAKHDILEFAKSGAQFDVIMCRRVLMYLPDQIAFAKALKALLKPDGALIVQEHDASILHSTSPLPLYKQARSWIWDTVKAEGANTTTGFDLHGILTAAGFSDITMSADGLVQTPTQPDMTAQIVNALMSRIEAASVSTAEEMDIDTLEERLAEERQSNAATTIGDMVFGAIARG